MGMKKKKPTMEFMFNLSSADKPQQPYWPYVLFYVGDNLGY